MTTMPPNGSHRAGCGSLREQPVATATRDDLLVALVHGWYLAAVVPMALDIVEDDPLASTGEFDGDLLRGLMEVPGRFWGRNPRLYDRYRAALRCGAARRRALPPDQRLDFWTPLRVGTGCDCHTTPE